MWKAEMLLKGTRILIHAIAFLLEKPMCVTWKKWMSTRRFNSV